MRPLKHPAAHELILERVLHALSDPVRLDIVRRLAGVAGASCGELDGGRPKSSVSHHFRVLREAGLIRTECAGTTHMNQLRRAELDGRFPGLMVAILGQPQREAQADADADAGGAPKGAGPISAS